YAVVPAPRKGAKAKGAKTADQRFAHALAALINEKALEGWEYLRTDTLPSEERSGLTGKTTVFQNMLIFRRTIDLEEVAPRPVASPVPPLQVLEGSGPAPALGPPDAADADDMRPAST
ncbi:MAG: DUF4177 domain-containing protein, partial [Rhodobacteraceae bacterium]|nr:DUF4177 domain-containing protein [Paracoccaceae bacterium]